MPVFSSGYLLRTRIAVSYGNSAFNLPGNCQTVFHSGCAILHSLSTKHEDSSFSTSSPSLVIVDIVKIAILMSLSGISLGFDLHFLIINDVEHLFIWLLATCISYLEKCLFRSSAHFSVGLFVLLLLSCKSSLYSCY